MYVHKLHMDNVYIIDYPELHLGYFNRVFSALHTIRINEIIRCQDKPNIYLDRLSTSKLTWQDNSDVHSSPFDGLQTWQTTDASGDLAEEQDVRIQSLGLASQTKTQKSRKQDVPLRDCIIQQLEAEATVSIDIYWLLAI